MKKTILVIMAAVLLFMLSVPVYAESDTSLPSAATPPHFKDLPTNHWAYQAIMLGVEKGYIAGDPNGNFRPNDSVTVAEFLKMMLMSMAEKNEEGKMFWSKQNLSLIPEWKYHQFIDRTASFEQGSPWYKNYAQTAKNLDIIRDEYEGRYNEPLTRERAAHIINRLDRYFQGAIQSGYANVAGPLLLKDYLRTEEFLRIDVAEVALRGIMIGNTIGYFNPKSPISRAEAAKIFMVMNDRNRSKPSVNLSNVPHSIVPNPGYQSMIFVFANSDIKKVYDAMAASQKNYSGPTDSAVGTLQYYGTEELKENDFNKTVYADYTDSTIYYDFILGFNSNTYTVYLSTIDGRLERASKQLDSFLNLIDKNNASTIKKMINDGVSLARQGRSADTDKVISGRQVRISSTYRDYIAIGISAYSDKK